MDDTLDPIENSTESSSPSPIDSSMDSSIGSIETTEADATSASGAGSENAQPSRAKQFLKKLAWVGLGMFCLILFTILKLPEDRIRNYVQGMISSQLSAQGITLNASQSSLSIGFGVSYTMKDITLSFPPPQDPIHIDQVSVSPSILSLLTGKVGATIRIENKNGVLHASFSTPMNGPSGPISFSFNSSNMDLGSLGVLPASVGIRGSAIANGEGHLDGDTSLPATLNGKIQLDLNKIVIDQQTFMGFSVPRLSVSEGKADIEVDKGKALIKTLRLGKAGNTTDDLRANVTGDVVIGKNLPYSTLNLKADLSFSQNVLKAFILLDAIMGPAKQADGSYAYTLTGPLNSPNAAPVSSGAPPAAPSAPAPSAPQGSSPGVSAGH